LCEALAGDARSPLRRICAFSASQARSHRDIIARFGCQFHRNEVLGGTSTEDERAYLGRVSWFIGARFGSDRSAGMAHLRPSNAA
jgi:uncharacterized protein (DUF924 family)